MDHLSRCQHSTDISSPLTLTTVKQQPHRLGTPFVLKGHRKTIISLWLGYFIRISSINRIGKIRCWMLSTMENSPFIVLFSKCIKYLRWNDQKCALFSKYRYLALENYDNTVHNTYSFCWLTPVSVEHKSIFIKQAMSLCIKHSAEAEHKTSTFPHGDSSL